MIGGTIDIPKVGQVPKVAVVGIGAAAAGFVGWKWWHARNGAGTDATATDPGFDDAGTIPGVAGAVSGNNAYGGDTGGTGGDNSSQILTNAQWSNDALTKLAGSYEASDIVAALGNYLGGQPLSDAQQTIVRAAIAVSGYPPVGSFSIVSGGNTSISVAPTLTAGSSSATSVALTWTAVAGASTYRVYRSGATNAVASVSGTSATIDGLQQNASYTFTVKAVTPAGTEGPSSNSVSAKTTANGAGAISGRVTTTTASSIHITFKGASNATRYMITVNGKQWASVAGSPITIPNLKSKTSYRVGIAGVNAAGVVGPYSYSTVRTK